MSEPCILKTKDNSLTLAIYVDDGLLTGQDTRKMKKLQDNLGKEFKITAVTSLKTFLGIEIKRDIDYMKLKQSSYAAQIVERFNMENSVSAYTPILTNGSTKEEPNDFPKPTEHLGIKYEAKESKDFEELVCYIDSDYAGDPETRKSTTGYVILYGGGLISWCSRKQPPLIAWSSTEAEFITVAECCKQALYLKTLIEELTSKPVRIKLTIDNQGAIELIKNGVENKRSKHIDLRYRFIIDKYRQGIIELSYCPTDVQVADIFTKPLGNTKFNKNRDKLVS
ncbi:Copia protein [Anthophora plagiata]